MRKEFIQCATLKQAKAAAPWAGQIIKVDGGWMAFESVDDGDTWLRQQ
jgi:hypothetical protein